MQQILIHAGMPKTGTTYMQYTLKNVEDQLKQAGACYVPFGRNAPLTAHHQIAESLQSDDDAEHADFVSQLNVLQSELPDIDVFMLSSEAITNASTGSKSLLLLSRLSDYPGNVRLVYFIRSFDDNYESMFLHQAKYGQLLPEENFDTFIEKREQYARLLFEGLAVLEASDIVDVQLHPYSTTKDPLDVLLASNGIDFRIEESQRSPRSHSRLGLKIQAALRHLDLLFSSAETSTLLRGRLVKSLEDGDFSFDGDSTDFTLWNAERRRSVVEDAAEQADRSGFRGAIPKSKRSRKRREVARLDLDLLSEGERSDFRDFCLSHHSSSGTRHR